MDIIIASNNKGKIKEFKKILEPIGYNVISQSEAGINLEIEENGTTYEENANLKAQAIYNLKHIPVLADDSGIEVDYLNGEPGIYSARYLGDVTQEQRNNYILEKLENVQESERSARFTCAICYINEQGEKTFVKGIWNGIIAKQPKGENGFGYDPIFMPNGENITVAEMSEEEKNKKSHRAIAFRKLLEILK